MAEFVYNPSDKRSLNTFVGKVYGYMFFGLLLTAIIAFGLGILFNIWIFGTINTSNIDYSDVSTNINANGVGVLLGTLIVSGIGLLVMSLVVTFTMMRGKHSVAVPALIYSILMGTMLSSLVVFIPWEILGITFAITAGIFGIMYLIATLTKGSLSFLGILGIGLFLGAMFISLIGIILTLTGVLGDYTHLYWIVSLLTFAAILFITIYDMWRIKVIAQSGEENDNLALYCAFILYVDFINIFLRVLRIVLYLYSKRR